MPTLPKVHGSTFLSVLLVVIVLFVLYHLIFVRGRHA